MRWRVVGRVLSSRWFLGTLAGVVGALGFTLLGCLFGAPAATAAELPPLPVAAPALTGVPATVDALTATPQALLRPALPVVAVPVVGNTVRAVSAEVSRLPVPAVVAKPVHNLVSLVESATGTAEPHAAPRWADSADRGHVAEPVVHSGRPGKAAPTWAAPVPLPVHSAAVPIVHRSRTPTPTSPRPNPFSSWSGLSAGHGSGSGTAVLTGVRRAAPGTGFVRVTADQGGREDNVARPGVTPD